MRIAIVSPYSWTYPGGVNRHVESLAGQLIERGHEVRVTAPWDPPDRTSRILHQAQPENLEMPDYLVPVGRTVGFNVNGSVGNLSAFPAGITQTRRALREFQPDVCPRARPPAAPSSAGTPARYADAPVVGTFHAYSTKPLPNTSPASSAPAGSSTS